MNSRTFSGPIICQNVNAEDQRKEYKKQLTKNESQPPCNKDYTTTTMGRGKSTQRLNQHLGQQRSSKVLNQNQFTHIQSTSSSTLLSAKTPNKTTMKLFNT